MDETGNNSSPEKDAANHSVASDTDLAGLEAGKKQIGQDAAENATLQEDIEATVENAELLAQSEERAASAEPQEDELSGQDSSNDKEMPLANEAQQEDNPDMPRFCPKCGTPLSGAQQFCGACGTRVAEPDLSPQHKQAKQMPTKLPIIIGAAAVVIVVAVVAFFATADLRATPEELFNQGKYEAAYNKADDKGKASMLSQIIGKGEFETAYRIAPDDKKESVLVANLAASLSNELMDNLKDPNSFELRNIYYQSSGNQMILEVGAKNSMGGMVSNWYYYTYNNKKGNYGLFMSVADLEDEKIYQYADSSSEKTEKILKNSVRSTMRDIIADKKNKIDSSFVDGVNLLFKNNGGSLSDVELMKEVNQLYPEGATA